MLFGLPVWISAIIEVIVVLAFLGLDALFLIWLERKVAGIIQGRPGPYRVGPHGLLQTLADGIKMFTKEDVMPGKADKWLWTLAPVVLFAPAVLVFVVIPWGPHAIIANVNIGILFVFALGSFSLISDFMGGWGSNNKYSLIGSVRTGAQLMSYEIPMILSVIGVVMMSGSLSLQSIVQSQSGVWYVFPQILGFIVFYISALAEYGRAPFDLMEAESELVAGYFTEYSGLRWGLFMMAEYTNLFTGSAIASALFLGGWHGPWVDQLPWLGWIWFLVKAYALVIVAMWIRWTLPRVRIDQLMDLGWKFLIPLSLINIVLTGIFLVI